MPDGTNFAGPVGKTPGWLDGYVPSAAEWNAWWAMKLDASDPFIAQGPYLRLAGGVMTGTLTLAGNPVAPTDAATKGYVDATAGAVGGPFLPISGGTLTGPLTVTGATTLSRLPLITDGTRTAPPSLTFATVAAMSAYQYTVTLNQLIVSCQGYLAAGDGGGGDFTYVPQVTKTTSTQTTSGAVVALPDTSSLAVGQLVQGTNIAPHTFITRIVANVSITMSKSVLASGIAVGATLTFQAGDVDGAFTFTANGGVLRRRLNGKSITFEQAGIRGDYIMPLPYLTNAAAAAAATTLSFADTSGIQIGWWAHHPSLPFGTTVTALTTTSVTLSNPVGPLGIGSGDTVCFNPVATDNTTQLGLIYVACAPNSLGIEFIVSADKFYYFGPSVVPSTPILQAFSHIRGQINSWTVGRTGGAPAFSSGIVLHPTCYIRLNGYCRLSNVCVIRAGLPAAVPGIQTYARYLDQWHAENGVLANPLILTTSATTASGTTLTFASTAGVTVGMYGTAPNFLDAMRVTAVTATTVTFLNNILSQITAGTAISFGTNYRSVGLWINQSAIELDHVYVLGFNTGVLGTSGGFRMNHVVSDGPNGFDCSGNGMGTAHSNLRAAADWTSGMSGSILMTWNIATGIALASGGTKYQPGDLLFDELNNLVQITTVDANGGITGIGPLLWRGGCYKTPPATTSTRCLSCDPQGSYGTGGGMGTGATLAPTLTPYTGTNMNYLPGRGYYIHDRFDNNIFVDSFAAGHHYGWIISNCWFTTIRGGYEGRLANTLGSGTVGMWAWNTPSWCSIEAPYIGGNEFPLLFQNVDGHAAIIHPKLGQGANTYARLLGGQIIAVGLTALGNQAPQPAIVIDTGSRGVIDGGVSVTGSGPAASDPVVRVNAGVMSWKLNSINVPTEVGVIVSYNWLVIDPSSEPYVTVSNCAGLTFPNASNPMVDGPRQRTWDGPNDRSIIPQQISVDPSAFVPTDGSPSSPLTLHSLEGGAGASRNLLLARGGTVHDPALVGFLGTGGSGPVLDAIPGTMLITTATVPSGGGGAGYWPGDVMFGTNGGMWAAATVDAVGQVLTVTNKAPAKYTGAAPTNPVSTRTDAKGGYLGAVALGLSGGGVTASLGSFGVNGYHYYAGTQLVIGVPGLYQNQGGITVMVSANPAGVQATGTLTINALGQITGVTITNPGSGYSGIAPQYQINAIPPAGCTLNLGAGVASNTVSLNPSAGPTTVGGTLAVAGATTLAGMLGVTGGTTLAGGTFTGTYAGNHTYSGTITHSAAYNNTLATGMAFTVASNASVGGNFTMGNASVNYFVVSGAPTNPQIAVTGTGTNGSFLLRAQGNGSVNIGSISGGNGLQVSDGGGGTLNTLQIVANVAGTPTIIRPLDAVSGIQINATAGGKIGFNAATPIGKYTLTGAKGANAALASVIALLVSYGLAIDSTSA
jgi:hypothetical protein